MEKAYKLLAKQENISNNEAKDLIDAGLVSAKGQILRVARAEMSENTKFSVQKVAKPIIVFENDDILVVNKPPFFVSEKLEKIFKFKLLNRLDKETSGIVLLYKNEEFKERAIKEFKNMRVKKTYIAIVQGIVSEEMEFDEPILTIKGKTGAFSRISPHGKSAITRIFPLMISGKKSLVKIEIDTGRTHQIRVHLSNAGFGIIGDEKYAKNSSKRMFLHAYELELLDLKFRAKIPNDFNVFGFEIGKEI